MTLNTPVSQILLAFEGLQDRESQTNPYFSKPKKAPTREQARNIKAQREQLAQLKAAARANKDNP